MTRHSFRITLLNRNDSPCPAIGQDNNDLFPIFLRFHIATILLSHNIYFLAFPADYSNRLEYRLLVVALQQPVIHTSTEI